jgi:hypothetical protein
MSTSSKPKFSVKFGPSDRFSVLKIEADGSESTYLLDEDQVGRLAGMFIVLHQQLEGQRKHGKKGPTGPPPDVDVFPVAQTALSEDPDKKLAILLFRLNTVWSGFGLTRDQCQHLVDTLPSLIPQS